MDIFKTHSDVLSDYQSYINSFIRIKDEEISRAVEDELEKGKLWPEPLIHFNPSFLEEENVSDLVSSGDLQSEMKEIFHGYRLYKHQVEAIKQGISGKDFIVTSGTGSGKSLTYIGAIFNYLLKNRVDQAGIKAVIIYPMNALINSQCEVFEKYANNYSERTGKEFPISYARYTGQEGESERIKIRENPPDILLTNYMMMELILTRLRERTIRDSIYENLKYLVFDELHTYRGRQGSDVALLIRRIKTKCRNPVNFIGISATMVSGGSIAEQKEKIAEVASTIFGKSFNIDQIIGETLTRSFNFRSELPSRENLAQSVVSAVDPLKSEEELKKHPTAIWLENRIALSKKEGILVRNRPKRFSEISEMLVRDSGKDPDTCNGHLQSLMRWISSVNERQKDSRYTFLPFKLHQFFSQTGSVYTTLDQGKGRLITLEPGVFVKTDADKKPIFSNVFSRYSGHAFLCVNRNDSEGKLEPREFKEIDDEDEETTAGYLIIGGEDIWNPLEDMDQLPDSWVRFSKKKGIPEPIKKYRGRLPQKITFDGKGNFSLKDDKPFSGWFMPCPLLFDPTAGLFFDTKTSEGTKLTRLGSEGRSTSTTITTFSVLNRLEESGFDRNDQKLLSFTDNRQDAALQAGHFNDFINVVTLRAGIYKALKEAPENQLTYKNLGESIFKALNLPFSEYANRETVPPFPNVRESYDDALKKLLVYRALYDLRRGWRVILPNLEQCALLNVDYANLAPIASSDEGWNAVPFLNQFTYEQRQEFIFRILDFFRREYSLFSSNYLTEERIRENQKEIEEKLKCPWKLESRNRLSPNFMRYETLAPNCGLYTKSMGINSAFGKYVRRFIKETVPGAEISGSKYTDFIRIFMDTLEGADYLKSRVVLNGENKETKVYLLKIDKVIWEIGDKKRVKPDIVKQRFYKTPDITPNLFFQQVYLRDFSKMKKLYGEDHTGQLNTDVRIEREEKFREGAISALFCSPTMELGIDIRNLSVVHMRNAPPNPANYAQRSGRAGRSGQAALVFTYCSTFSNHDRYYFNEQRKLVAGAVAPPRIDLYNKELLASHLNALFLSEVGSNKLDDTLLDLIDVAKSELPLSEETKAEFTASAQVFNSVKNSFNSVIDFKEELMKNHAWFSDQWIDFNLARIIDNLNDSMKRWRSLYRSARNSLTKATQLIDSGRFTLGSKERKTEKRNQDQAQRQLDLLRNKKTGKGKGRQLSEFYPYRYLASEGFLPGYNFTRLPLRTFIPKGDSGEYISRSRLIALREFGPRNIIYHSGSKYDIKQLLIQNMAASLMEGKLSINSGYFLTGEQKDLEVCPFSGVSLSDNQNKEPLSDLLEMGETRAVERDRISCEEEERITKGYKIDTYFSVDDGNLERVKKGIVKNEKEAFLNIRFIPTARLVHINRGWRTKKEEGFPVGVVSGRWIAERELEDRSKDGEEVRRVRLFTTNTADALYIEPIKALALEPNGVKTLQYALKRAIENIFQVESNEIGVVAMGDPKCPNIFLYEASEGSLGILSQFVEEVEVFKRVVNEAIKVCRFDEPDYKAPASYDDLLSYYNQRDHLIIDRFLIKDALEKLQVCRMEMVTNKDYSNYEEHYQNLKRALDPNSSTETTFLEYLYKNDLRLPDAAQQVVEGIYVQPDFVYYGTPNTWVFCDGTPHEKPDIKHEDEEKRQAIRNRGDDLFVYYYKDSLEEKIQTRQDIFKKVR